MNILFLVLCSLGAETDLKAEMNALLDEALATAWNVDDPRAPVRQVLLTMLRVDPQHAIAPTRTAARRLAGLMQAKPQIDNLFAPLAEAAAAHDRALRDELLAMAIESARKALASDELWVAPDEGANHVRHGFPTQREVLQRARLRLGHSMPLWQIVRDHAAGDAKVAAQMTKLLADARASGGYSACAWITYEDLLVADFIRLDSRWAIAVVREEWDAAKLARLCD